MKVKLQSGYTIIELMVVIVMFITIAGLITTNLNLAEHNASLSTTLTTLVADLKHQQNNAITGEGSGSSADYFGIHFSTNSYTMFNGTNYNPTDSTNETINLDPSYQFTNITFTNGNLIYIPNNGEIYGYSSAANSLTLLDTVSKQQKILQVNYLGVITSD